MIDGPLMNEIREAAEQGKDTLAPQPLMVYTVWRPDDESTHIFSTQEKADAYSDSLTGTVDAVVMSTYIVDEPGRYYGKAN